MGISVDTGPAASQISASDLVAIASDPERYQTLLQQLTELRNGQEALIRRTAEVEEREMAADAKAAMAERIRADYQARAARLESVLH